MDSDSGQEKAEEHEEEGSMAEKSRWWDHYYVRYFVGSVFAVPLMLALSKTPAVCAMVDVTGDNKLLNATVLGAAGLAFCYVASAPILLLHAARGRHSNKGHAVSKVDKKSKAFALVTVLWAVALGVWVARGLVPPVRLGYWSGYLPFAAVVATEVIWILRTPIAHIVAFYRGLAEERAQDPKEALGRWRREYIQSYRDMREHGNALLILVMEAVLTAALLQAASPGILFGMLVLWVMPGAFVWFIATTLEAHLGEVK